MLTLVGNMNTNSYHVEDNSIDDLLSWNFEGIAEAVALASCNTYPAISPPNSILTTMRVVAMKSAEDVDGNIYVVLYVTYATTSHAEDLGAALVGMNGWTSSEVRTVTVSAALSS